MNICYLGLGSNQQVPERQLRKAIQSIKALRSTVVTKVSSFYWSKAWGLQGQQDFCNAVIEITTLLSPLQLLNACQKIEKKQGRIRKKRWGPRIIDIDVLFYESRIIHSKKLMIPHPQIQFRDFVLIPLIEINPNYTFLPRHSGHVIPNEVRNLQPAQRDPSSQAPQNKILAGSHQKPIHS